MAETLDLFEGMFTEEEGKRRGFHDLNDWLFFPSSNKWGIPDLLPNEGMEIPDVLIDYREPIKGDGKVKGVSFFLQDYRFRSVWTQAKGTVGRIKAVGVALSPDFSPYGNYPLPLRLFNVYRNRWCGRWFQENGVNVIPTVTWNDHAEDDDFIFAGIPEGSVVCFSIVGSTDRNKKEKEMDKRGIEQLMERIKPSKVLVYGEAWREFNEILPEDVIKYPSRWARKFNIEVV